MRIPTLRTLQYDKSKKLEEKGIHNWFAWYPVEADGYIVWLRHIERGWNHLYGKYTYWEKE